MNAAVKAIAALFILLLATAHAAPPQVTLTFDPVENGALVYARIAPLSGFFSEARRLWFRVLVRNDSAATLTATSMRVTMTGYDYTFPQDIEIASGATKVAQLAEDEVIAVADPAPATVTIALTFAGNPTPKITVLPLALYVPLVAGGAYTFPANETDLGPEEYFAGGTHLPPEGQRWGTDWKVHRILSGGGSSELVPGGDSTVNADYLGWGTPIRAMAAGTVLRTSLGWENNPAAGKRVFQQMAEQDGAAIVDVKVASLGETGSGSGVQRVAVLTRMPDDTFRIAIWDLFNNGRGMAARGTVASQPGETVQAMAIEAIGLTRFVTSMRLASNVHRFIVWDVSADGMTVARTGAQDDIAVREVALARLTDTRVATAVRTDAGNLRVAVFSVGANPDMLIADTYLAITAVGVTRVSDTRFAASARTVAGTLRTIVWDYTDGDGVPDTLARRGERTGEAITRLATAFAPSGKWVTATRTVGGLLKLTRWSASTSGNTLTPELETTTASVIQNTALAISPGSGTDANDNVASVATLAGSAFHIHGWGDPGTLPNTYTDSAERTLGTATAVSIAQTAKSQFIVGARTAEGNLKLSTWHWGFGGGNSVYVLHGDCRVLYAHLLAGSVDVSAIHAGATVAAGQMLGRMGNSGSSGSPHTHIHADRIFPITSIADMIAREALRTLPDIGARPMPLAGARTMRLSWIAPGGEGNANNNFTTMNGHGVFDMLLGIRPGTNARYVDRTNFRLFPNGRKEWLLTNPETGGPFRTVPLGLSGAASGTRMFIRGGSYPPAVIFSTPMTVRRYDFFDTEGSVVIGQ